MFYYLVRQRKLKGCSFTPVTKTKDNANCAPLSLLLLNTCKHWHKRNLTRPGNPKGKVWSQVELFRRIRFPRKRLFYKHTFFLRKARFRINSIGWHFVYLSVYTTVRVDRVDRLSFSSAWTCISIVVCQNLWMIFDSVFRWFEILY